MAELKPCPFCGGEARLLLNAKRKVYGKDEYRTGVVACCNVCEARMFYGSKKLAIEAWNRRQPQMIRGRWEDAHRYGWSGTYWFIKCNNCGYERRDDNHDLDAEYKFCPNCGAQMEGCEQE